MAGGCGESKQTDSDAKRKNPVTAAPIVMSPSPAAAGRRRRSGMPAGAGTRTPARTGAGTARTCECRSCCNSQQGACNQSRYEFFHRFPPRKSAGTRLLSIALLFILPFPFAKERWRSISYCDDRNVYFLTQWVKRPVQPPSSKVPTSSIFQAAGSVIVKKVSPSKSWSISVI